MRAPSEIPVEDSTKVVTVEVPRQAPQQVAMASAMRARSPPGRLPFLSVMPAFLAVPMRVPTVSKQSTRAKLITAVTRGRMPFAMTPGMSSLKATSPRSLKTLMVIASGRWVSPIGKPMMVVMMMPMTMEPFTL